MPAIPLRIAIKHISSLLLSFTIIGSAVSPKNARADAFIRSGWQWISLLLLLGLLVNSSGVAHADSMKFSHYNSGGNHCCWWIAAEGDITPDTPREFEKFLGRAPNPKDAQMLGGGGTIRLHSAGGSLIAALELGYLIRKYHLYTTVGRTTPQPDDGICASACAYAFLGGVQRTLDPGAKLGVHRFYRGSAADNLAAAQYSGKDLDDTQRVFSALVLYIRNMGVDLALGHLE